jgi:hypothetical protein
MIVQMIESIMYFGIGFLLAALSVLIVAPLVHDRAVRLTMRRVEATIPLSMAELQADKDLQRAEFAMSTRRLETIIEQFRTKGAGQLAELGRKGDAINRLKIELGTVRDQLSATEDEFAVKTRAALDAQRSLSEKQLAELKSELDKRSSITNLQKVEIVALEAKVETLRERLTPTGAKPKTEAGLVPLVPPVPMDSSKGPTLIEQPRKGAAVPLMPTTPMHSSQNPRLIDQRHKAVPLIPTAPMDSLQNTPLVDRHKSDAVMPTAPLDSSQRPTPNDQRREQDGFHFVPKDWSIADLPKTPMDFSQNHPTNNWRHKDDVFHFVPKDWPTTEISSSQSPSPKHQRHEGDILPFASKDSAAAEVRSGGPVRDSAARGGAFNQRMGTVREGPDFSAGLRSVEPSIRVASRRTGLKNQVASGSSSIGRRTLRAVAACFIAALIGVGGSSAWLSHNDGAKEIFRNWTPSLGFLSSMSTTKYHPAPVPAVAAMSPELVHELEAMPRDLAVVRRGVEQLTEKQEQMARNIADLRSAEHDIKKKASSPHLQSRTKLIPWPETKPTTIAGWTLRGITNGTAVLEGPHGTWRAMQGDTVPGVGRVESMVRWGGRLIVATSSGLISTP